MTTLLIVLLLLALPGLPWLLMPVVVPFLVRPALPPSWPHCAPVPRYRWLSRATFRMWCRRLPA